MYKNEDYLKLAAPAFIHYLRTKHKKYVDELPEQLEKWMTAQKKQAPLTLNLTEEQKKEFQSLDNQRVLEIYPIPDVEKQKLELATKILCSMNTGLATAESVVDHAWEMAELLIKKSKE